MDMSDMNQSEEKPRRRQFGSDNYAGVCPEAMAALVEANADHAPGYGDDGWTRRACDAIRELFETDCESFFVFNGTAANSLALASLCQSYHAVIVHELAHAETDECGAPEFFSNGTKLLVAPGAGGRLDMDEVERLARRRSDIHFPKPRVLSLTESTEIGTVYTAGQVGEICERARGLGLRVHMDGARFANAVAALGVAPAELTWRAGVDVLCFGMTKNGIAVGEAVVFFDKKLACEFDYRCKQAGQLASKMRFLSAPWIAMLREGVWLRNAGNANRHAARLGRELGGLAGVELLAPVEANAVFARLPDAAAAEMRRRGWIFYDFIGLGGSRFMCAWDTTDADVDELMADMRAALKISIAMNRAS